MSVRGGPIVPDVAEITASITFDVAAATATAVAYMDVAVEHGGRPALDLRQPVDLLRLDGASLSPDAFAHRDLGAGYEARMRVLDVDLGKGRHRLEMAYHLGTPDAAGALPVDWRDDGVRFDLWMSDLAAGRYLEMWVPAPLCGDRFALNLDISIVGTDRPHVALSNAGTIEASPGDRSWQLHYPAHFTALSPMLVVAPADEVELRQRTCLLTGRDAALRVITARHREVDADLEAVEADIVSWLGYLSTRYGPWIHGDAFTAFVWGPGRGMEYDGATTASVPALEHEVFHSWFGRGVKPAMAADGWIDEAFTTWSTASRRSEGARFAAEPLGLDDPPIQLYPPHPWARETPRGAYADGARLFSGIAHLLGGPDRLRSAMSAWYRANAGGLITTDGLEAHLRAWSGANVSPLWARYVHGQG